MIALAEYRAQLYDYLKNRMMAIAPNLTVLVGELVGARLIAHAGSLINLAQGARQHGADPGRGEGPLPRAQNQARGAPPCTPLGLPCRPCSLFLHVFGAEGLRATIVHLNMQDLRPLAILSCVVLVPPCMPIAQHGEKVFLGNTCWAEYIQCTLHRRPSTASSSTRA